ncbi:kinase-like protein [Aspergillus pseudonomiae]|nr:kinase-like protein [Aspergillus pseudonomiae]
MAIPWNIRESASQLFFTRYNIPQYEAWLAIAHVPHPDRSILGAFINDALDPQEAARCFLRKTSTGNGSKVPPESSVSQFLSDWKVLIDKFRPRLATSLSTKTKKLLYERDGGRCCLTCTPFKSDLDHNINYAHMISPHVFAGPDLSEGAALSEMLGAFLSRERLEIVRSFFGGAHCKQLERLDNIWMLSTQAFDAVKEGEVFLIVKSRANHPDTTQMQTYYINTNWFKPQHCGRLSLLTNKIHLENRSPQLTPILNEELIGIHTRFSNSLAWMEAEKYMNTSLEDAKSKAEYLYQSTLPLLAPPFFPLFRKLWIALPSFVRASVYDGLLWVGARLYGPSLSMTVFKLPFGLYLRRGSPVLIPKYYIKARTLDMVEQSTHIPAPRAIDVLETPHFSYLLMTCVPGRPIGQMLHTMTDEQVKHAVTDLKRYISELRKIPNTITEFQICNSQGGGILDWRIPDTDFNKRAAKSHDIRHDIVFTPGDLNPRNILAENGKITGIVDWEIAGWFPEYWEYTKAHYTVRSVIRWLADVVDEVFEGYRNELVVENLLSNLLSPF